MKRKGWFLFFALLTWPRESLKKIQRAGAQVIEWNVAQPFDQATRRAFGRRIQGSRL